MSGPVRRRAQPLLGTLVDITVAGHPLAEADAAIDAAFAEVRRLHGLLGSHDPGNALAQLNATAHRHPVRPEADLRTVLAAALHFALASDGAFDPCVGATLESLGRLPRHADPCAAGGCWRDIQLDSDGAVHFHRPLRIDLGGIAKGYAVDRAIAVLAAHGIGRALVNAGGDLRALGPDPWAVHLRDPGDPGRVGEALELRGRALATSASYFSRNDEHTASDLIRPGTGNPDTGNLSVSVEASDCLTADALTKVVLFAPPQRAAHVLARHDARAWLRQGGSHP